MEKNKYLKYLASNKWLIKKAELINIYVKNNWTIDCHCCGFTEYLQVHHFSYKNFRKQIEDSQLKAFNEGMELWKKTYG